MLSSKQFLSFLLCLKFLISKVWHLQEFSKCFLIHITLENRINFYISRNSQSGVWTNRKFPYKWHTKPILSPFSWSKSVRARHSKGTGFFYHVVVWAIELEDKSISSKRSRRLNICLNFREMVLDILLHRLCNL